MNNKVYKFFCLIIILPIIGCDTPKIVSISPEKDILLLQTSDLKNLYDISWGLVILTVDTTKFPDGRRLSVMLQHLSNSLATLQPLNTIYCTRIEKYKHEGEIYQNSGLRSTYVLLSRAGLLGLEVDDISVNVSKKYYFDLRAGQSIDLGILSIFPKDMSINISLDKRSVIYDQYNIPNSGMYFTQTPTIDIAPAPANPIGCSL